MLRTNALSTQDIQKAKHSSRKNVSHQQEGGGGRLQEKFRPVGQLQHGHLIAAVHHHAPTQKAAQAVKQTNRCFVAFSVMATMRRDKIFALKDHI